MHNFIIKLTVYLAKNAWIVFSKIKYSKIGYQ